jgi:uncharacterized protein YceK
MKRVGAFALVLALAGCSSTEKQPAPSAGAATNTAPTGIQQASATVPRTGTTGTGSFLVSGPRPAKPGDCQS